jgi:hypothetical protein
MLATGAGVASAVLALDMRDMTLQDRAVGSSQEPTPGPDTHRRQVAQLGYNSTTKSGLKAGRPGPTSHGTLLPGISGSKQIEVH